MKKKGFTLIELLAVTIVIAVIFLITMPIMLGVVERSRKAAFRDSVYGLIETADLYIASNLGVSDIEYVCDGETCSSENQKLKFKGEVPISGSIFIENNEVRASFISNGKYCANGRRENLKIANDCVSLDESEAEIDESLLSYTSTTNSVTIMIPVGFAIDKESGIKEYQVTLNGETKIIEYTDKDEKVTFNNLKKDKEYEALIKVINNNNIDTSTNLKTKTLTFINPSIVLTNTPTTAQNGYLKSQVAKVTYNNSNITSPTYYVKTTREGTSSLAVTQSCGNGTTPSGCTNITSTTNLATNTWYKVSGNVNVTYNQASDTTGTIYAITYDGTNYSGASTATISKITKKVGYKVNHYQMNVNGSDYTLKETDNLTEYAHYEVTPAVKSYTGFTSPTTQTVTLAGDGSTVVNYYYTRNKYKVTVNKGTGIASVSGSGSYYYGASVTVGYTLSTGYHFSNWTGTYTTATFKMPVSNVTMKANGVANTYYIAYAANGGSGSMATTTCKYGSNCTLRANSFSRVGYTFAGWSGSNGGNYSNGQVVSNLTSTNGATITMTAKWTGNTYYIAYAANGGSGSMATTTCKYGSNCTLRTNGFSRAGYTFSGWAGSNGGSYSNGQVVSNLTSTNGATITMTANWNIDPSTYCSVHGHTVTNWTTTETATCQHATIQTGTCSICGATQTKTVGTTTKHFYTGHYASNGVPYSICNYCGQQVNYYIDGWGD